MGSFHSLMMDVYYFAPAWLILCAAAMLIVLRGFGESRITRRRAWRWCNLGVAILWTGFIVGYTILLRSEESHKEIDFTLLINLITTKGKSARYEVWRGCLMNALLFFPLGLCLPFAFTARKQSGTEETKRAGGRILWTALIAFVLSFSIEAVQYRFSLGQAEANDVLFNVLGAAVGALAYWMYEHFFKLCDTPEKEKSLP